MRPGVVIHGPIIPTSHCWCRRMVPVLSLSGKPFIISIVFSIIISGQCVEHLKKIQDSTQSSNRVSVQYSTGPAGGPGAKCTGHMCGTPQYTPQSVRYSTAHLTRTTCQYCGTPHMPVLQYPVHASITLPNTCQYYGTQHMPVLRYPVHRQTAFR